MAKFLIFLLLGVTLARAAPGVEFTNTTSSTPFSNHLNRTQDAVDSEETHLNFTLPQNSTYEEMVNMVEELKKLEHEKIVVVFGNSGSGKTTLMALLTEANLTAQEVGEGLGVNNIVDGHNRSYPMNVQSRSMLPNVMQDDNNSLVYYDLPGVDDMNTFSRFPSMGTYRTHLFPNTKSVKILLVVDQSLVAFGGSRFGLLGFLNKAVSLANNTDHYNGSIAMVVNKVFNDHYEKNGKIELVSDETVIQQVAYRLRDVKENLKKYNQLSFLSTQERTLNEEVMKLIDVLLIQNNNIYERIGVLRRPMKPGRIHDMKLLMDEKQKIKKMIKENLEYVSIKELDENDIL